MDLLFRVHPPTRKQWQRGRRYAGYKRATARGLWPAKDDGALWIERRTKNVERLLRAKHWITFAEVAEWLARDRGTINTSSQRLAKASRLLIEAFRDRSMNPNGRAIAMLVSTSVGGVLSIANSPKLGLIEAMASFDNDHEREKVLWPAYFERTWMPCDQCVTWFRRNGWDIKPAWDTPSSKGSGETDRIAEPMPKKRRGRSDAMRRKAGEFLRQIFPGGMPSASDPTWTNDAIVAKFEDAFKKASPDKKCPSSDTILRAAERRIDIKEPARK